MNEQFFNQRRFIRFFALIFAASAFASFPSRANAQSVLSWARIEFLRNRVQLVPQGRGSRTARVSDMMGVGDALRTASSSRAELRFNDGSLARIGQRAVFRFTPNTRNFQLSNGTMLLLIPPGQGRTTIQTPNAVTGIQGSGLFVRAIPETNTTIIGALTNNVLGPMEVYCESSNTSTPLYAGQMAVVETSTNSCATDIYEFDLREFYETSGLAEGLRLSESGEVSPSDELQGVRQEILEALEEQGSFGEDGILPRPTFITLPEAASSDNLSPSTSGVTAFENSVAAQFHGGSGIASQPLRRAGSRYPVRNSPSVLDRNSLAEEVEDSRFVTEVGTNRTNRDQPQSPVESVSAAQPQPPATIAPVPAQPTTVPATPATPSGSEQPVTTPVAPPDVPAAQGPATPATPAVPATPATPATPAVPENPVATPATPATPAIPATPATPATPAPEVPIAQQPTTPDVSPTVVPDVQPTTPSVSEPDVPSTDNRGGAAGDIPTLGGVDTTP